MSQTTTELIYAISQGDAVETERAFSAAMAEKLAPMIDARRIEVAQSMFNQAEEQSVEETPSEE
jgi:hypothetical protein